MTRSDRIYDAQAIVADAINRNPDGLPSYILIATIERKLNVTHATAEDYFEKARLALHLAPGANGYTNPKQQRIDATPDALEALREIIRYEKDTCGGYAVAFRDLREQFFIKKQTNSTLLFEATLEQLKPELEKDWLIDDVSLLPKFTSVPAQSEEEWKAQLEQAKRINEAALENAKRLHPEKFTETTIKDENASFKIAAGKKAILEELQKTGPAGLIEK